MNHILIDILGEQYDSINDEIKGGKLEGVMSPRLYDSFDSWIYIKDESRFQLKKNPLQPEETISKLKDLFSRLYKEARKYAEPRELNCLSNIDCLDFGPSQGAHVLKDSKFCSFISFYGFQMGN